MSNRAVWKSPAPEFKHPLHSMHSGQPRLPPEAKPLAALAPNGAVRSSQVNLPSLAAPAPAAPPAAAPPAPPPAAAAEVKPDAEPPKEAGPSPAEEAPVDESSVDTAEAVDGKKKGKKGAKVDASAKAGE